MRTVCVCWGAPPRNKAVLLVQAFESPISSLTRHTPDGPVHHYVTDTDQDLNILQFFLFLKPWKHGFNFFPDIAL